MIYLSIYRFLYLPSYLVPHLFIYLPIYLFIHGHIYPFIHLCVYLFIYLSIYVYIYFAIFLFIYLSTYLYNCLSIYQFFYLSIYVFQPHTHPPNHASIHATSQPSIQPCYGSPKRLSQRCSGSFHASSPLSESMVFHVVGLVIPTHKLNSEMVPDTSRSRHLKGQNNPWVGKQGVEASPLWIQLGVFDRRENSSADGGWNT